MEKYGVIADDVEKTAQAEVQAKLEKSKDEAKKKLANKARGTRK